MPRLRMSRFVCGLGDLLVVAAVTALGFATHGETGVSYLPRILATLIPLSLGWFLPAFWLGLFRLEVVADLKQLWRPAAAMLFAAPFAGWLRAALLNSTVIPIFVLVLGLTTLLGLLAWRILLLVLVRRGFLRP